MHEEEHPGGGGAPHCPQERPPPPGKKPHRHKKKPPNCSAYPDLLTAAMIVTIGLTEGRSNQQLKTLLNFVSLLQSNINFVLAQRLIDDEAETQLDVSITDF